MKISPRHRGFTLIEVLLVVVIIAILAGIVIIAVNPARQIAQTNNAQRDNDVRAILDAVHQYSIDNRGVLPASVTDTPTNVGSGANDIDICTELVPTYISAMPYDPTDANASYTDCTSYSTGYNISADANGRVTVAAPGAELSETISVTR
jgi:type IV pilus assembly protein PilA